jgi:hypothetical protein
MPQLEKLRDELTQKVIHFLQRPRALLYAAIAVAFARRIVATAVDWREPADGLEVGYLESVASLASGSGLLMRSVQLPSATPQSPVDVVGEMKLRERSGTRICIPNPYPASFAGWLPSTLHTPGYSILLFLLYQLGNYSGMMLGIHFLQVVADALTCLALYIFARNLFGGRVGLMSAWLYALNPLPIILILGPLPDAFSVFFAASVMAAGSYIRLDRFWAFPLTGAIIAIGSQFRPELLTYAAILVCCIIPTVPNRSRLPARLVLGAFACVLILLPWMYWTHQNTGHVILTGSGSGAVIYEHLGAAAPNPWHITIGDAWVGADAARAGFKSPWSPEADSYYRAKFFRAVCSYPLAYIRIVLIQRLPNALVPRYTVRASGANGFSKGFSLAAFQARHGLSIAEVCLRYPGVVLRNESANICLIGLSALLFLALVSAAVMLKSNFAICIWLVIPWASIIALMCLMKQVEPRNVSANLVVEFVAAAFILDRVVGRKLRWPVVDCEGHAKHT